MNSNEMLDLIKEHCPWLKEYNSHYILGNDSYFTVTFIDKDSDRLIKINQDLDVWLFIQNEVERHLQFRQKMYKSTWFNRFRDRAKVPVVTMKIDEAKLLSKIESLRRTVNQTCNEMINEIQEAK